MTYTDEENEAYEDFLMIVSGPVEKSEYVTALRSIAVSTASLGIAVGCLRYDYQHYLRGFDFDDPNLMRAAIVYYMPTALWAALLRHQHQKAAK